MLRIGRESTNFNPSHNNNTSPQIPNTFKPNLPSTFESSCDSQSPSQWGIRELARKSCKNKNRKEKKNRLELLQRREKAMVPLDGEQGMNPTKHFFDNVLIMKNARIRLEWGFFFKKIYLYIYLNVCTIDQV